MVHFIHFNKYGRQQLNIQGSNQSNPKLQNPILSKSRLVETGYLIPSSESYHFSQLGKEDKMQSLVGINLEGRSD